MGIEKDTSWKMYYIYRHKGDGVIEYLENVTAIASGWKYKWGNNIQFAELNILQVTAESRARFIKIHDSPEYHVVIGCVKLDIEPMFPPEVITP